VDREVAVNRDVHRSARQHGVWNDQVGGRHEGRGREGVGLDGHRAHVVVATGLVALERRDVDVDPHPSLDQESVTARLEVEVTDNGVRASDRVVRRRQAKQLLPHPVAGY
jgi:hypothetical protein